MQKTKSGSSNAVSEAWKVKLETSWDIIHASSHAMNVALSAGVYVRACVRAYMRACVRVCGLASLEEQLSITLLDG